MQLITDEQFDMLLENARKSAADPAFDPRPVVKLFTPDGGATWLISAVDPDDPDILEGVCDLGLGCAEFGTVRLSKSRRFAAPSACRSSAGRWSSDRGQIQPSETAAG